jgi:hypothetical protein
MLVMEERLLPHPDPLSSSPEAEVLEELAYSGTTGCSRLWSASCDSVSFSGDAGFSSRITGANGAGRRGHAAELGLMAETWNESMDLLDATEGGEIGLAPFLEPLDGNGKCV